MRKTVVMVPTFNERGNIEKLIQQILGLNLPAGHTLEVLVVDDNSPDGTSETVAEIAKSQPRVQIMTRYKRRGRGTAGIDGFKKALETGADYAVEMDADFSHDPKYLPNMITAADHGADVVLGSRFIPGGSDSDRGPIRQIITKLAGIYIRNLLGLKVRDVSSGYRLFTRRALESIDLENILSTGPSIVTELLYKSTIRNLKIVETPIVFIDRRVGETKLNWITLLESLVMVLKFRDLNKRGQLLPK